MKIKSKKQMNESDKVDRVYNRLVQISEFLQKNKSETSCNIIANTINIDAGFISYLKNQKLIVTNSSGYYMWNKSVPLSTYPLAKTCYDNYYKVKSLKQDKVKNTVTVTKEKPKVKRSYNKKSIEKPGNNYWNFLGGLIKIKKWY
jgi:hypothetical protein